MPPTLPASSKIKQARSLVNSGVSSADARRNVRSMTADTMPQQRTGFMVDMPSTIPAEALNGKYSVSDVRAMRDNRAQADAATEQFNTDYGNLTSRIGNTQLSSPFVNPEETLNRLLLRGTTDTQRQLDEQGQTQADAIRGFAGDYTQAGTEARTQFGIPELQTNLADTRNRIAERQVQLRQTLRDFETNSERRGVAREFVDSEKAKVQSEAASELADLSIIESAQLGNLTEARAEVDNILAEKKQAFEFENAAIEAEIARLDKMDTRESQARSEQLQIALQERTRNIETALANEKEQRGYMVDAAANGADQGTLAAIRNAKTPQEAAFLAGPFIGKIDRMQAQANIANTYSQISDREERLKLAREAATLETEKAISAGLSENEAEAEKALGMFAMLNELSMHPGFGAAVGPNVFARGASPTGAISAFVTGDRSSFISLAEQIANTLTLDNMDKLKGPATDKDVELVAASVSKLKNRDMSQSDYGAEITKIADAMKRIAINKGATSEQIEFYGLADKQSISEFDEMWGNNESTPAIQISTNF